MKPIIPPIKKRILSNKEKKKEDDKNINIRQDNDHWNNWRFQSNWKKLEIVDPKNRDSRKNIFCTSTFRYYIKDGNNYCHFVGNLTLKPMNYDTLFNRK